MLKAYIANRDLLFRTTGQHVCLAHNLMMLFERCLEKDEGIRDTKVERKRERRAELEAALAKERGEILNPMVQQCRRSTQRSLQFIRWLRHCLWHSTSWTEAVKRSAKKEGEGS